MPSSKIKYVQTMVFDLRDLMTEILYIYISISYWFNEIDSFFCICMKRERDFFFFCQSVGKLFFASTLISDVVFCPNTWTRVKKDFYLSTIPRGKIARDIDEKGQCEVIYCLENKSFVDRWLFYWSIHREREKVNQVWMILIDNDRQ